MAMSSEANENSGLQMIDNPQGEPNRISAIGRRATEILSNGLLDRLNASWEEMGQLEFEVEMASGDKMHHDFSGDDGYILAKSMLSSVDFEDYDVQSIQIEFTIESGGLEPEPEQPEVPEKPEGEPVVSKNTNQHAGLAALGAFNYKVTSPAEGKTEAGSGGGSDSPKGVRVRDLLHSVEVDLGMDQLSNALTQLSKKGVVDVKSETEGAVKINYYSMNWSGWRELWMLGQSPDVEEFDIADAMGDVEDVKTGQRLSKLASGHNGPKESLRGNSNLGSGTGDNTGTETKEEPKVSEPTPLPSADTRYHEILSMLSIVQNVEGSDEWFKFSEIVDHSAVRHEEDDVSRDSLNTALSEVFLKHWLVDRRDMGRYSVYQMNEAGREEIENKGLATRVSVNT